jgi:multisubunit Na+/H+ antiporter MnhB subunit
MRTPEEVREILESSIRDRERQKRVDRAYAILVGIGVILMTGLSVWDPPWMRESHTFTPLGLAGLLAGVSIVVVLVGFVLIPRLIR